MSWFNKPPVQLIDEATAESIPPGEQNLALNLDLCDMVRSKRIPPEQAVKAIKKRLMHLNPNVQISALNLLDLFIKNGGSHFLQAVATPDFMNTLAAQVRTLRIQNRSPEVVALMTEYIQLWAHLTKDKKGLDAIWNTYTDMKDSGVKFPPLDSKIKSSFVDSQTAPDWVDSDTCMKSGQPFTFYNRKHHCRNCGGVYLQEYCKDFIPLPQFGISTPVRVCVDCKAKLAGAEPESQTKRSGAFAGSNNKDFDSAFDRDLKRALELSLSDQAPQTAAPPVVPEQEMDDDMKQAIAASLADMQATQATTPKPAAGHQQLPRKIDQGMVKEADFEAIAELRSLLENAQPHDAIYDQKIIDLNRLAMTLQPKVVHDLTDSADKLQTLEDLHGRIMSISAYYDKFLDAELRRNMQRDSQMRAPPRAHPEIQKRVPSFAPSYAPAYSQPLTSQNTGSAVPSAPPAPSAPEAPTPHLAGPAVSAPNAPSAPPDLASLPSAPTTFIEPQREPSPEPEPMLIEL